MANVYIIRNSLTVPVSKEQTSVYMRNPLHVAVIVGYNLMPVIVKLIFNASSST